MSSSQKLILIYISVMVHYKNQEKLLHNNEHKCNLPVFYMYFMLPWHLITATYKCKFTEEASYNKEIQKVHPSNVHSQ